MSIMTAQICEKCHKILKFVKWENRNGVFVKIMECDCEGLTPVLPDNIEKEMYNENP